MANDLHDKMAYSVADALLARGVPLVLATGYAASALPSRYAHIPRCAKPAELDALARALFSG